MISSFSFGNESLGNKDAVKVEANSLEINYPCSSSIKCTFLSFYLNKGIYKFELYGANGGIAESFYNAGLQNSVDSPGSGGYVSAFIALRKRTKLFAFLGGKGHACNDGVVHEGGYNGGGGAEGPSPGTGGGSTDIRAEKNDEFHRIIVAGGGGGSDNFDKESIESNDGKGGSGGGTISQSFFVSSNLVSGFESTQTKGYSFFQGETGKTTGSSSDTGYTSKWMAYELPGGGGGWFGGYSSHHCNGGGSGGSSFALSPNATIPSGVINIYDKDYNITSSNKYAFSQYTSPYLFYDIEHKRGVWNGDGKVIITKFGAYRNDCFLTKAINKTYDFLMTLIIMIDK